MVRPTTDIADPLTKYRWLTKSVLVEGLPTAISSLYPPPSSIIEDFEKRVCDFIAYQVRKSPKGRGLYDQGTVEGLIQSCLSSVWPLASDYRHLRSYHMAVQPNVECYWRRCGENYISQTNPLYIMHTNMALGLFCSSDYVGDGLGETKCSPLHLGLFKRSFDQILPFGGIRNLSPFSMAHTVFMMNDRNRSVERLLTHALVQLFSQSTANAVQSGFKLDQDLPYPLVSQGIITDGRKFTFVCFQLNTLDLRAESEDGKCNVFWKGPTINLYQSARAGQGLINFSNKCAVMIFKFMLHEPLRRRPRQFGGRSLAMPVYRMKTDGQKQSPISRVEWEGVHSKLNRVLRCNHTA